MISMRDCPKFTSCSAPVCPLDPGWRERTQMDSEPVCLYLLELVKDGGMDRVRHGTPDGMAEQVATVLDELGSQQGHAYIRYQLRRAAKTGSRIASGHKLRNRHG
jgi:hypothetical protein